MNGEIVSGGLIVREYMGTPMAVLEQRARATGELVRLCPPGTLPVIAAQHSRACSELAEARRAWGRIIVERTSLMLWGSLGIVGSIPRYPLGALAS